MNKEVVLSKEECSELFLTSYPNYAGYGDVHYNISDLNKVSSSSRSNSSGSDTLPPAPKSSAIINESSNPDRIKVESLKAPSSAFELQGKANPEENHKKKISLDKKSDEPGQSYNVNISVVDYTVGSISNFSAFGLENENKLEESGFMRGDTFGTTQVFEKQNTEDKSTKDGDKEDKPIRNSLTIMANETKKFKKSEDENSGKGCAQCLVI